MKKTLFILTVMIFSLSLVRSQNLYDYKNSLKFANYLYETQQYKYAAQEYERVLHLTDHPPDSIKLSLIKAYRKSGNPTLGIKRFRQFYNNPFIAPPSYAFEYMSLHLKKGNISYIHSYLDSNQTLQPPIKRTAQLHLSIITHNWDKAEKLYQKQDTTAYPPLQSYRHLTKKGLNRKKRSLFIAGGLSTLVPGLGKVYTGNLKDAIFSFLMVGLNAWQSYRGFRLRGFDNAYGWIFGGIGLTFYAGNIYGSVKSAQQFNNRVEKKYIQRANALWDRHYK